MIRTVWIFALLFFSACATSQPEKVQAVTAVEQASVSGFTTGASTESAYPLSWEKSDKERKWWSMVLRTEISDALAAFDSAKDAKDFCPKYTLLSRTQRVDVWSEMVARIAYYESGWNPKSKYQEPPPPKGPGTLSVGLLQVSTTDGPCPKKVDELMKPAPNLECGVKLMRGFITRDGIIAHGNIGIARYWSVMRPGHHIDQIKAQTRAIPFCK